MKKFTENLEQWKDDPSLRMDRCAVNKSYATAAFDLQPFRKHLDAAFCSKHVKNRDMNQSFIQKDVVIHTCQCGLKALFRCLKNVATFVYC